jgi:hypothetical protein
MTQRSILAGTTTTVIIKAGSNVTVRGCEGDTVTAITTDSWGLQIGKKSDAEIGRARAAIGDFVLFDIRVKTPLRSEKEAQEVIEVQMGGSGQVLVPFGSNLKIYAGKDIEVQGVNGQVDAYSGRDMSLLKIGRVGHASAGRKMDLDAQALLANDVEFSAGGDLRFHVRDLSGARIRVKDLGGFWEGRLGDGASSVYLKSGGDVTLVTDQVVEPQPPNYILGKIEKPTA